MKFYLSSYEVGASADKLLNLIGSNRRVGVIANASDGFREERRQQWAARSVSMLTDLGLEAIELDLRHYFNDSDGLQSHLAQLGLVWVVGGNTFILRRAMRESGFDKILTKILETNDLVYGGFSAGACVLAPSLRGIHLADEPEKTPSGYSPEIIWDGLGLIDFHVVPHFRSVHRESQMMENVVAYYEGHQMKYVALADGEAIVIDGQVVERVGYPTAPRPDDDFDDRIRNVR